MGVRDILRAVHFSVAAAFALPALAQAKPPLCTSFSPPQVQIAGKTHQLQPIAGEALRRLIVGSIIAELAENGRAGPSELYSRDGIYQFASDIMPVIRMRHQIEQDQVFLLGDPDRSCFAYFKTRKGSYRRLRSDGAYSVVSISPFSGFKSGS